MVKGIDVSEFQGQIDWNKVKNDGIEFAILRVGFGMDIKSQDDKYIERNIEECERLSIPFGVYLFSYANTVDKAKSEAEHTLRLIKGHKLALGVWYDIEDNNTSGSVGKETLTNIINIYCNTIKNAEYDVGIYANLNWLENKIEASVQEKWSVWVAQYNSECQYKKDYVIWQYSSSGKVDGISGNVDMNYYYGELDSSIDEDTSNEKEEPKKHIIDVDGKWGTDTTKKAQEVFGTTVDGIVTDQYKIYKSQNPGLISFEWLDNPSTYGSELIRAMQKKVGANVDGHIGPETIKKMQKWLGTIQDGCVSNPSDVVRAFQRWLNKQ